LIVLSRYVAPVFEIHNALGVNWEEPDPFYYRKVLLKIFWDDQEQRAFSRRWVILFVSATRFPVTFRRSRSRFPASQRNAIATVAVLH